MSGWDGQLHAFPSLGEVVSEALCTHSALTSALTEPGQPSTETARWCPLCLEIVRGALTTDVSDRARWQND